MKTNRLKTEKGRSMVEMLGVMAIVGILSIVGLYGFTVAMNKYKANELLNEASKRAVTLAMQVMAGAPIPETIPEFTDPQGYTFGIQKNGSKQFKLTLSNAEDPSKNIEESVCEQIKALVGSEGIIQEVGENCSYFLFNNDLSKEPISDDENTDNDTQAEPTCPEGTGTDTSTYQGGGFTVTEGGKSIKCYCSESGEGWKSGSCVDLDNLYTMTSSEDTYDNWAASDSVCSSGHWATLDEIIDDFRCTLIDDYDNGRYRYDCKKSDEYIYGLVNKTPVYTLVSSAWSNGMTYSLISLEGFEDLTEPAICRQ